MITRSFTPIRTEGTIGVALLQFERDIAKCLGLIDKTTAINTPQKHKIKQKIAIAYTSLIQSHNASYTIVFNESNSNFEIVGPTKELADQKAKLENQIKIFTTIHELKDKIHIWDELKDPKKFSDNLNQLKNIDTTEFTEEQKKEMRVLTEHQIYRPKLDKLFDTSILEEQLVKINAINKSIASLQNDLNGLNKLVDDTINDFTKDINQKFPERVAANKKKGFVAVALVVVGFAVAAVVCAVVAPPLVAIPLAIAYACCSGLSLGIGPFVSNYMSKKISRYESTPREYTPSFLKAESSNFPEYKKRFIDNVTDISKKYFAKADDSKSQTAELGK
jgi:hypothetical protein